MALNHDKYTYRVTWSEEDNEYVGLCAEFPSLSWLDDSPESAFNGIRQVVAQAVLDIQKHNEPVPEPIAIKKYSGQFLVQVSPEMHRNLILQAAESGISLNRLANVKLSQ